MYRYDPRVRAAYQVCLRPLSRKRGPHDTRQRRVRQQTRNLSYEATACTRAACRPGARTTTCRHEFGRGRQLQPPHARQRSVRWVTARPRAQCHPVLHEWYETHVGQLRGLVYGKAGVRDGTTVTTACVLATDRALRCIAAWQASLAEVEYGLGFCPAFTDRDGPSSDKEDDLPEEIEVEVDIDEDEPALLDWFDDIDDYIRMPDDACTRFELEPGGQCMRPTCPSMYGRTWGGFKFQPVSRSGVRHGMGLSFGDR